MLDLETMGTSANSAIISMGAVRFDDSKITDEFYEIIDLESCLYEGLEINASTVMWWMKQSDQARAQFNTDSSVPLITALLSFREFINEIEHEPIIWGKGPSFDNVILANAFKKTDFDIPWKFRNERCYRTLKAMHPEIKMQRIGTHHNALNDAKSQAMHLIEILAHAS